MSNRYLIKKKSRFATRTAIINDVRFETKTGRIPKFEARALIKDIRAKKLAHPAWEEYGLRTAHNGRPAY